MVTGKEKESRGDKVEPAIVVADDEEDNEVPDPKAEVDHQRAYHRMKGYGGSDRETQGHG
jgi:hypothetical protein